VVEYRLLIKPSAVKEIEAAGAKRDRQRIVSRIQALAANPRPLGCEKLAGVSTLFRVRQGAYRIIYTVNDAQRTVEVVKVGHRREVYRSAP
jgi:mRNA interferase RelE/StbE